LESQSVSRLQSFKLNEISPPETTWQGILAAGGGRREAIGGAVAAVCM
jgi:hypothetical protein